MATSNTLEFTIKIDDGQVKRGLDQVVAGFNAMKGKINEAFSQVTGLQDLEKGLTETGKAVEAARERFAAHAVPLSRRRSPS